MKTKHLFMATFFLAASTASFSQLPPEPNPEGDPLPIVTGPGNNGTGGGGHSFPKSPVMVPTIYQNGHSLYLYSDCAGATLCLMDGGDEVVYSIGITDEMDYVVLPSTLVGIYRLDIICGDFTFYCNIEL